MSLPAAAAADCPAAVEADTLPAMAARKRTTTEPQKRKAGRPPVDGETRSARLAIKCTPDELERWHAAARQRGVDLAPVARELLDEWARREGS